ncbi:MAG: molybdopterin molybdotransferase MoeA [Anaerolineales bacterium]|nr:molybdopterin molybdotransferase MoeA [Anaerolineales bacterium]
MDYKPITFHTAIETTLAALSPLESEYLPLEQLVDRKLAEDVSSSVDSPSIDASLKDGYAVRSADIRDASDQPVTLKLIGSRYAGDRNILQLQPGTTVRVLTGAAIPAGADAVLAEEFTTSEGSIITVLNIAEPGRNILHQGSDVRIGQKILSKGAQLHPAAVGLLASAGHTHARVFRRPYAALLATGNEVIAPGTPLEPGKLYASNLVTLAAWCTRHHMESSTMILKDKAAVIEEAIRNAIKNHDIVITSGGAWSGERDLVVKTLDSIGWEKLFNRVRMGPGKGVAFGLLEGKPVFCLPGGPPSNLTAFLQLVLPALHHMAGFAKPGLPVKEAVLADAVSGQSSWTQFIFGTLQEKPNAPLLFTPLPRGSRLQMMASAESILTIPEGIDHFNAGEPVLVQLLI